MKSIARTSIVLVIAFVLMGVGTLIWWYRIAPERPLFRPYPAEVVRFVESTPDLERLRKLTLVIVQGENASVRRTNQSLDHVVSYLAVLAFACALVALLGWAQAMKAYRLAKEQPLGWLRWL